MCLEFLDIEFGGRVWLAVVPLFFFDFFFVTPQRWIHLYRLYRFVRAPVQGQNQHFSFAILILSIANIFKTFHLPNVCSMLLQLFAQSSAFVFISVNFSVHCNSLSSLIS